MIIRYFLLFGIFFLFSCNTEDSKVSQGKLIFDKNCVTCHGLTGNAKVSGASDLTVSELSKEQLIEVIRNGRSTMSPYKGILSDSQIDSVAKYVYDLSTKK